MWKFCVDVKIKVVDLKFVFGGSYDKGTLKLLTKQYKEVLVLFEASMKSFN